MDTVSDKSLRLSTEMPVAHATGIMAWLLMVIAGAAKAASRLRRSRARRARQGPPS